MGFLKKVVEKIDKAADKKIDTTVEQAGVKPADRSKPAPKKPGDAKFVCGIGERIGFIGLVAFTVGAALFGAVGCKSDSDPGTPPPTVVATCEEDQSWCWDCSTMGNRRCGDDDGAVQR